MSRIVFVAVLLAAAAGCSKSETAQARSREVAPRAVRVEAVRQESVKRAVDVVGTLAPVDQAKAWLEKVSAATVGRLRPAASTSGPAQS